MKKIYLTIIFFIATSLVLMLKSQEKELATHGKIEVSKKVDSIKIKIKDNRYKICLDKKHLVSNNKAEIENFVKSNLNNMKNSKIYIIGKRDTPFSRTKPIFDLLKKYGLMNFKLIAR